MKIETRRGHLTISSNSLTLDWPLAKGGLECPNALEQQHILQTAFAESISRGFVEEEASIHAALACAIYPQVFWNATSEIHRHVFPRLWLPEFNQTTPGTFPRLINASPGIYPIVDNQELLEKFLEAGVGIVQLRMKDLSVRQQREAVRLACRAAEQAPESQLFINDYWRAALEYGAFGIHLGQEDLLEADLTAIATQGLRLGLSSHSYWEVARAMWLMPSYLACGPIFPTRAKAMNWIPQGLENLRYWVSVSHVPIVAIAGINADNLKDVADTGADSAAVIQAIASTDDPISTYRELRRQWDVRKTNGPSPQFYRGESETGVRPARPTLAPI